jgi:hypothetical protein
MGISIGRESAAEATMIEIIVCRDHAANVAKRHHTIVNVQEFMVTSLNSARQFF